MLATAIVGWASAFGSSSGSSSGDAFWFRVQFNSSIFESCVATGGGGVFFERSEVELIGCAFHRCEADVWSLAVNAVGGGGGVMLRHSKAILQDCNAGAAERDGAGYG